MPYVSDKYSEEKWNKKGEQKVCVCVNVCV